MKIKVDRYSRLSEYERIEVYASVCLSGDDYDTGALEAAIDTARNNSKAIGRLLDVMAGKGIVTAGEVTQIIQGYVTCESEFLSDETKTTKGQ